MIVEVEGDPDEAIQWNETQEIIPAEDSDQDMEQQEVRNKSILFFV